MCVCVFEIHVLKIFSERLLCWLDHWLSCMLDCIHICVFHISKNCCEKLPRHFLDTSSIPCYLSSFCSWIWWVVPRYLLNTSAVDDHFLDIYLDSFLDTFRHLHLSSFTEGLYIHSSWSDSHFFDLSRSIRTCSSPKHSLSLTPNLFLCDFSSFFKILLLLVSF